ncbi:HTH_Tnp_Tc3_2 domain-containing protein [Trichonephila clavipes]|nr:HTH_Tnp_Tc3_2 domain-containing protein [Trichonephila clavipes]
MLLDVSMCLVVLFSDFGINTNPKILVSKKTCSRPTTSYNTCRRPFSSSFGTKREDHYCAAARCETTFKHQEEESPLLRCEIVFTMQSLYARRPVVCVPLNGRQRRNRLCWAREHVSWTQQQWASVLFTERVRFTMEVIQGVY